MDMMSNPGSPTEKGGAPAVMPAPIINPDVRGGTLNVNLINRLHGYLHNLHYVKWMGGR